MNNEKNCFNMMTFVMNLIKNVLIKKRHYMILPTYSVSIFLKLFFLFGINGTLYLLCRFSLCIDMSANYSFTEDIVVTKIELCYLVCFVKPFLPRKKKGVDDILSLLFFFLLCQISMHSVDI